MKRSHLTGLVVAAVLTASTALAQHPAMPPGMTHAEHLAQMKKDAALKARGTAAMGFDQDHATHHFILAADGGLIQVEATDAKDVDTQTAIRAHLREIASAFAAGDFAKPLTTHDELPPGAATMHERKSTIRYQYEPSDRGARVRITTTDAAALAAVHAFLRYQIAEHATGDPVTVQK